MKDTYINIKVFVYLYKPVPSNVRMVSLSDNVHFLHRQLNYVIDSMSC